MENNLPAALLPNLPASTPGASLPWEAGGGALPPFLALYLDGTGDYASFADAADLTPANGKLTISLLVRPASWPADASASALVSKGDLPNGAFDVQIGDGTYADDLLATFDLSMTAYGQCGRGTSPPANVTSEIVMVFDKDGAANASRLQVYVNRNPQRLVFTGTQPTAITDTADLLRLGAIFDTGAVARALAGYIQSVRIYNRSATAAEVLAGTLGTPFLSWPPRGTSLYDSAGGKPATLVADAAMTPALAKPRVTRAHCVGTSITWGAEEGLAYITSPAEFGGYGSRGGWRTKLGATLLARGLATYSLGAQNREGGWMPVSDGVPGALISNLLDECEASAGYAPDWRTLEASTNDMLGGTPLATQKTGFDANLAAMFTGTTAPLFVIGAIPIATAQGYDADIASLYAYQEAAVATALAAGKRCYFVAHGLNNTTHLGADGYHLSDAGNTVLAAAVAASLQAANIVGPAPTVPWQWSDLAHAPELHLEPAGISGSPIDSWTNTGSAGGSFTAAATARPAVGSINGVACADFDGSNDTMASLKLLSDVFTATEFHVFAVIEVDAIATDSGLGYSNNDTVFGDNATYAALALRSTPLVQGGVYAGAVKQAEATGLSLATPMLIEWSLVGGTMSTRVGGGATATIASGAITSLTSVLNLGASTTAHFFNGRLAELVASKVAYTGADVTNIRQFYADTYGVTV